MPKEPSEFLEIQNLYCEKGCILNIQIRTDGMTTVTARNPLGQVQAIFEGTFSESEIQKAIKSWQYEHQMNKVDHWNMQAENGNTNGES